MKNKREKKPRERKKRIRRKFRLGRFFLITGLFIAFVGLFVAISNLLIVGIEGKRIVSESEASKVDADCILIFGAGVWSGHPSPMLEDRLEEGLNLYNQGVAEKIIVSGDHGQDNYDEVNVMKKWLVDKGVPDSDIFMDHAGFSTYESVVRAKKVFGVKRMVVVTQKYHLYRALYICKRNGIEAVGVASNPRTYSGQTMRDIREVLARDKDIFTCLFNVKPKFLGEVVDITGDGNVTNDR